VILTLTLSKPFFFNQLLIEGQLGLILAKPPLMVENEVPNQRITQVGERLQIRGYYNWEQMELNPHLIKLLIIT
jgi:hypothetical protein